MELSAANTELICNLNKIKSTSVYEQMREAAKSYNTLSALSFYGIDITYEKMLRHIDEVAKALQFYGIKKGDVVMSALPSIPEAVFLFYATNKVGAIYCALDCRSKSGDIEQTIDSIKPKLCFIPDFQIKEFSKINNTTIVCTNCANYIGVYSKFMFGFAAFFKGRIPVLTKKNVTTYPAFIKNGAHLSDVKHVKVIGNDICGYFHTSGTTYGKKCVVITNENINTAVFQFSKTFEDFLPGERLLGIMPPFTCYGITVGIHTPLTLGMQVRLVPLFDARNTTKLLCREKPNYMISVPSHWDEFIKNKSTEDLSFLKIIVIGGDKVRADFRSELKSTLAAHNSNAEIRVGYGLTETTSTGTSPSPSDPEDSVGKAHILTEIGIFDDKNKPVPVGNTGEICIYGPTLCRGYLNDKAETDKLLQMHSDGKLWLHSGDRGYMDKDGYVYFCERIKRMFVRFDGTKMSPYEIEQAINKCDAVSESLVVAIDDKSHSHGKLPKFIIVLKDTDNVQKSKNKVLSHISDNMPQHMQPAEVEFTDKLALTKNGKIDYFATQIR